MQLEVGMYVRTKDRGIAKFYGWSAYDENKVAIHTHNEGDIEITPVIDKNTIIKASHTLLGNDKEPCLIEVGDYVNGYKISAIYDDDSEVNEYNLKHKKCLGKNIYDEDYQEYLIYEEDIKSIVTKEQFSSMEYKINE